MEPAPGDTLAEGLAESLPFRRSRSEVCPARIIFYEKNALNSGAFFGSFFFTYHCPTSW